MGQDVIVVGARVAGAATALLLARRGLRVRLVDRAAFPSDTLSSHQVQLPGVALLNRWGLLDRLRAAGVPPTRRMRFDADPVVLDGVLPPYGGVAETFSPRRTLLDQMLIDAASAAGADFSPRLRVEELVGSAGRVTGVRGTTAAGTPVTEHARLVVGADGKRSLVAAATGAGAYLVRPARCFACYSYWSGLPLAAGEIYQRPGLAAAAFPTGDGLSMVYISAPVAGFAAFRRDVAANFQRALDRCGDLGERVRAAHRAERFRTTPDQPNRFHVPYGPGWALVGDAGVVMDSISAQGISNALRDADLLAGAIASELDGRPAFAAYQRHRDRAVRPIYDLTMTMAAHHPLALRGLLLSGSAGRPAEVSRFLGALTGALPVGSYFSTGATIRRLGGHLLRRSPVGTG